MDEVLTFQLAAPLAAFGEVAVGERRGSWDRPGRSAVFGLVAACLGLDRADEAAHLAMEDGYGLALRVERRGTPLADYHTAQVPSRQRNRRFLTRAAELAAKDLTTILSRRDYRMDFLGFVALWPRAGARWPLAAFADGIRMPKFTPYVGRKSCPLMLPMDPVLTPDADPVAALSAHATRFFARHPKLFGGRHAAVVTIDADAAGHHPVSRTEFRRDRLSSRRRWQFALREEAVLVVP